MPCVIKSPHAPYFMEEMLGKVGGRVRRSGSTDSREAHVYMWTDVGQHEQLDGGG